MVWRCNDPNCTCQPAPKDPPKQPPPLKATLRGPQPTQTHTIDQQTASLDLTFHPITSTMILREKIRGPDPLSMGCKTYLELNYTNTRFLNLIGLEDNSLLLSIQITHTGRNLKPRQKYRLFWPGLEASRLYADLVPVPCEWEEGMMVLEVELPRERVRGWKTVALILATFGRISARTWRWIVDLNLWDEPVVAGLDWRVVEEGV